MKILLSGLNTVIASGLLIFGLAWVAKWYLYRGVGALLVLIATPINYGIPSHISSASLQLIFPSLDIMPRLQGPETPQLLPPIPQHTPRPVQLR